MSLDRLLAHGNATVREIGQKAVRYKAQLEQKKITQAEYDTLCNQLVNLEELDAAANTAEERLELQQAIQVARAFLGIFT